VIEKGGPVIALAVVGVFLSALTEEVAFRGFLYHGMTRTLGGGAAVLVGSALFALAHLPVEIWGRSHPVGAVVGALLGHFCFGVVMCRIRAATGAVWFPAGVHALWNMSTIGIGFWSFPEIADAPKAFLLLTLGVDVIGLFLAYGILMGRRWRTSWANAAIMMRIQAAERAGRTRRGSGGEGSGASEGSTSPEHGSPVPSAGPVFERFTPAARRAIVLAQEEARRRRDPAIGTEHLLLGLIADHDDTPAKALARSGVSLRRSSGPSGPHEEGVASSARIPFTPRAKLAIAVAIGEAGRLGHDDVGPEHLLLGVVADRRGEGARVLRHLGVRPERLRRAVLELIPPTAVPAAASGPDPSPAVPPSAPTPAGASDTPPPAG
jgi:hypothetical protein